MHFTNKKSLVTIEATLQLVKYISSCPGRKLDKDTEMITLMVIILWCFLIV